MWENKAILGQQFSRAHLHKSPQSVSLGWRGGALASWGGSREGWHLSCPRESGYSTRLVQGQAAKGTQLVVKLELASSLQTGRVVGWWGVVSEGQQMPAVAAGLGGAPFTAGTLSVGAGT